MQIDPSRSVQRLKTIPLLFFCSAAYGLIIFLSLVVAFSLASAIHASPTQSAGIVTLGLLSGIFGGLAFNFAIGPIQLKQSLQAKNFSEFQLPWLELIAETFQTAGLRKPKVWLVSSSASRDYGHNVLLAGFSFGRGIFSPALFVSEKILEKCTREEFQSILAHEIAHLTRGHLLKRLLFICGGFLTSSLASGLLVAFIHLMTRMPLQGPLLLLNIIVPVLATLTLLRWQNQKHELEADQVSVKTLGSDPKSLQAALEKLDSINLQNTSGLTRMRLQALQRMRSSENYRAA